MAPIIQACAHYEPNGWSRTGYFYSHARRRVVGYTIGFPSGCRHQRHLPLVIFLHGYGGSHRTTFGGFSMQAAASYRPPNEPYVPAAWVAVDGGNGYWHAHPGDNPAWMLVHELIPLCRRLGLGVGHKRIAVAGNSMGGYGALLLAEHHPRLIAGVALLSPAVWPTYQAALRATQTAWTSQPDFTKNDVIAHAFRLKDIPIILASGTGDPFHVYIQGWLAPKLPAGTVMDLNSPGGHDGTYFAEKAPVQVAFLQHVFALG